MPGIHKAEPRTANLSETRETSEWRDAGLRCQAGTVSQAISQPTAGRR